MNTLVHGFNVKDPEETVGKLRGYIDNPYLFNYGWRFFSVLWHNKKDAKKLKVMLDDCRDDGLLGGEPDIVYAHSNGCAIAVEAAKQGALIDVLVCINPALKVDTVFPPSIKHVIVIHTEHDQATKQAKFFDSIPFIELVIPNAWGAMGAYGYKGDDPRVSNWDLTKKVKGHSDFFKKEHLDRYMPKLQKAIDMLL